MEHYETIGIVFGSLIVLGGACWTGAKVAFVTTLILQGLFGNKLLRKMTDT